MDYFLARYYSSTQGRFTSPDEFTGGPDELYSFAGDAADNPTFYADLTNPQTLNKYQYCFNNPLRFIDPDGHDPVTLDSPMGRFFQGAVIGTGMTLANDGRVRGEYKRAARGATEAERTAIRKEARRNLTRFGLEMSKLADESRVGQAARHTESASRTSPTWNKIGSASKVAGRSLIAVNVVFSVTAIATAPQGQRAETIASEIGAWGGAAVGAPAGAKLGAGVGSLFGPGPGTAIGAGVGTVVGAGVGAMAGSAAGREMVKNPPPRALTVKASPLIPLLLP